jgi:hypothetical protein
VASLLNASQSVARKHVALRSHQLDVYTKTHALAKAVKNQTDRVAQTAKAAAALARRLDENPSASSGRTAGATVPGPKGKKGLEQDRFYEPSETNTVAGDVLQRDPKVRQGQADRYPQPNGTISTFESNVPKQGKDTFRDRSHTESQREPPSQQDATTLGGEGLGPEPSTTPAHLPPEQTPGLEGVNTDVFQSPRVAKILMGKAQGKGKSDGLISNVVDSTSVESRGTLSVQQGKGERISVLKERSTLIGQTDKPVTGKSNTYTQKLAADVAKDTANVGVCHASLMTPYAVDADVLTSGGAEQLEVSSGIFVPDRQLPDA